MRDRQKQISDGLAAAEQGQKELELAEHKSVEILTEAKAQAAGILEQANQRANHIIEDSKGRARDEGERLLALAQDEIAQQYNLAKEQLLSQVSGIAVQAAEKILQREVDKTNNATIVDELVGEI
tara:strand:+ start:127 stop:501 length:375 start_codon:yes stop_codon:yes gene_type:complete